MRSATTITTRCPPPAEVAPSAGSPGSSYGSRDIIFAPKNPSRCSVLGTRACGLVARNASTWESMLSYAFAGASSHYTAIMPGIVGLEGCANPPGWRPRAEYAFFAPAHALPIGCGLNTLENHAIARISPNSRRGRANGADDPAKTAPFRGDRNRHRRGASPTGYFRQIDPDSSDSAFRARQGVPAGAQAERILHRRRQGGRTHPVRMLCLRGNASNVDSAAESSESTQDSSSESSLL